MPLKIKFTKPMFFSALLVYRWGIEGGKFSEATALGLFQSVIGLILVLAADFVAKRMGEEGLI